MSNFEATVQSKKIFLNADEAYQKEVDDLLTFIDDYFLDQSIHELPIPIHYGNIRLEAVEGGYQVLTQDYQCGNIERWISDLSYFLAIIRRTQQAGKKTKSFGRMVPFRFDDVVIVANHTFEEDEWYAHHVEDDTWYLAPIDQSIDAQPLTGFKAYEVFPDHPEMYDLMHLPIDYIALITRNEIVSVLNKDSEDVWNL